MEQPSAKRHLSSGRLCEEFIRPLKLIVFLIAANWPASGHAQSGAAKTEPRTDGYEAIIVTAQRRPEPAGDVPISLTALSGEQLKRMQATDTADLGKVVPSLVMTRTSVFTQPFLRGVGKRSNLGVENSVATYVDGVYLASPISALLDLRGIERIEILNGPQGTLFGRNATGGVIQVITRDPSPEGANHFSVEAGTFGKLRGDAYLEGGSDRLAGNVAASLSRAGGFGTNVHTGHDEVGEADRRLVARSKWIWRPSSELKLTLAADYQDLDEDFSLIPVSGYSPIGKPASRGFHDIDQDTPNPYHFRYGGVSLKAEGALGSLRLISLSARRRLHANWSLDLDGGPQSLLSATPRVEQDQFSQELQLQSGDASRIKWVAGLYYIRIKERYDPTVSHYGGTYSALLGGRIRQTLYSSGDASSYAAYGQGTLPLGSATALTLGLRYTIEHRSVEANGERLFAGPPFVRPIPGVPLLDENPLTDSDTFREVTWRASLDRHLSENLLGYVSASRGFQSGGWNLQTPQNPAFGPETLNAFEGGLKFVDRSRRVRAEAGFFYYDYRDLQVSALTPVGQATTNATSAELYGMELQVHAKLGERTNATLGAALLHAQFKRFPNATCSDFSGGGTFLYAPVTCDVTGNRLPLAPKVKFNLGADHLISFGNSGTVTLSGYLAYNSGYFAEPDNVVKKGAFATVDLSAEWQPIQHGPSVRLWVLNLTDAHYYNALATVQTAGVFQNPATPRRFGVSMGYAF